MWGGSGFLCSGYFFLHFSSTGNLHNKLPVKYRLDSGTGVGGEEMTAYFSFGHSFWTLHFRRTHENCPDWKMQKSSRPSELFHVTSQAEGCSPTARGWLTIQLHTPCHLEAIGHQVKILHILRQHTVIFLESQGSCQVRAGKKSTGLCLKTAGGTVYCVSDPPNRKTVTITYTTLLESSGSKWQQNRLLNSLPPRHTQI